MYGKPQESFRQQVHRNTNGKEQWIQKKVSWSPLRYGDAVPSQEMIEFVTDIEKSSKQPNILQQKISELQHRPALEILSLLPEIMKEDIICLKASEDLNGKLPEVLDKPIFFRPAEESTPYVHDCSFDTFLSIFGQRSDAQVDVYDYSISNVAQRTRAIGVQSAIRHVQSETHLNNQCRRPLNFLNIENRLGYQLVPAEIGYWDIRTKIYAHTQPTVGKTNSTSGSERPNEFFILSCGNAVSTIHIDNGVQLTWVRMLKGRKIWYFPRRLGCNVLRWLAEMGSQYPYGYQDGWVKVEQRAGDLMRVIPF